MSASLACSVVTLVVFSGTSNAAVAPAKVGGLLVKVVPVTGSDHALDPSAFVASTCTW